MEYNKEQIRSCADKAKLIIEEVDKITSNLGSEEKEYFNGLILKHAFNQYACKLLETRGIKRGEELGDRMLEQMYAGCLIDAKFMWKNKKK